MATILLVDDDLADATLLEQAIKTAAPDVSVVIARTYDEALASLAAPDLRLVLLDLNLRGTTGLDILDAIRAGHEQARLPVLMFTTSAAQADVAAAYEHGANAFVTKPADLHETVAMMETICEFWLNFAVTR